MRMGSPEEPVTVPMLQAPSAITTASLSHPLVRRQRNAVTPNPSIERTRSGSAGSAFISFSAKAGLPPRASQLKR